MSEGFSLSTLASVIAGVALVVVIVAVLAYRRRPGSDIVSTPRQPRGRSPVAPRPLEPLVGGTLRLDGGVAEPTIDRPPETEENLDGATLRLVNACPNHLERRARWTCPYCRADFCEDCRRSTGGRDHCPSERCVTRAERAAGVA